MKKLIFLVMGVVLAGSVNASVIPADNDSLFPLYVVKYGYHTSIALPVDSSFAHAFPDWMDEEVRYFEFAWGDSTFFTSEETRTKALAKALLWPTPSVMLVRASKYAPHQFLSSQSVDTLYTSLAGYRAMRNAIRRSFWYTEDDQRQYVEQGLYRRSAFYRAHGTYYAFNTCNHWVESILYRGGIGYRTPVGVWQVLTQYIPNQLFGGGD
jgi:uncharacterized protein (TIGR02117 family)